MPNLKLEPPKRVHSAKRVICVDDNEFVMEILRWYLESLGYVVTCCSSGKYAIKALEKELPDAVILDFEMPEMDGGEVALAMKERAPQVPIVMFSGTMNVPQQTLDLIDRFVSKDAANAFALLAENLDLVLTQIEKRQPAARSSQKRNSVA
jgi:CheY-like chemotaxis protein